MKRSQIPWEFDSQLFQRVCEQKKVDCSCFLFLVFLGCICLRALLGLHSKPSAHDLLSMKTKGSTTRSSLVSLDFPESLILR